MPDTQCVQVCSPASQSESHRVKANEGDQVMNACACCGVMAYEWRCLHGRLFLRAIFCRHHVEVNRRFTQQESRTQEWATGSTEVAQEPHTSHSNVPRGGHTAARPHCQSIRDRVALNFGLGTSVSVSHRKGHMVPMLGLSKATL